MTTTLERPATRLCDHSPHSTQPPAEETLPSGAPTEKSIEEKVSPRAATAPDQAAAPSSANERVECLLEYANSLGLRPQVDLDAGVITGVKILGLSSRNGRVYRAAAMAAAVPLYESVKVNVNHPKGGAAAPRDYQDRLGCLRNVRAADGGLYGDLHFNPRHPVAGQLAWDAQWAPENVGLSHNVEARTSRHDGQTIVEQILRVNSVDLVADPATTQGLFESAAESASEPPEGRIASTDPTPSDAALSEARRQLADKRRRIEALLREARLPSQAAGPAFTEQLCSLDDDAARALIHERVQFYRSLTAAAGKPKSKGPAPDTAESPGDVRRWARLIT